MTEIPWRVNPVTIIAVMKSSDGLLYIGADSQWTDSEGLKFFQGKLRDSYANGKALAWGTAGNPQIGVEFSRWLDSHNWSAAEDWSSFIIEVANEFARLNGVRKDIGRQARDGVDDKDFIRNNLCTMLICGWISNESKVYAVMHNGAFQEIETLGGALLTIGTGAPYAEAIYTTQSWYRDTLKYTDEKLFSHLMYLTARHASQCSLPFECRKITPAGVQVFRSQEPGSEVEEITPASQSGISS